MLTSLEEICGPQLAAILAQGRARFEAERERRMPEWKEGLPRLDGHTVSVEVSGPNIKLQTDKALSAEQSAALTKCARDLMPWKKGPFQFFDLEIDAEWRSDAKWDRLAPHLPPLRGVRVLDVGCNNGYFLFRMIDREPALLLGIDPVAAFKIQFDLIQHYARLPHLSVEPLGVEHVHLMPGLFDLCLCLGVIYHHRNPIQQLIGLREALAPGGWLFLESIGIPGGDSHALFPPGRYARMGNVWFVPTVSCLVNWLQRARFVEVQVLADTPSSESEQRPTDWCPPGYPSLRHSLDPNDPDRTVEGHPAPRRFLLSARKRG